MERHGLASGGKRTVESLCSEVLEAHFRDKPFCEFPVLDKFCQQQSALLASLAYDDAGIPRDPDDPDPVPMLLLWDLGNEDHKHSRVYRYIDSSKEKAPASLYATSGAGKTRSILEYLSHNKGLYLLARKSPRDPGSEDLEIIFEDIAPLAHEKDKGTSYANLLLIKMRLRVLIYVRHAVHDKIANMMERPPTAYEWLLLQLYPEKFLGDDIFKIATGRCSFSKDVDTATAYDALCSVNSAWPVTFVDEAQSLSKILSYHFLNDNTMQIRSAFSAFLKCFLEIRKHMKKMGYPVFSGTGLSIDELQLESNSAMAKHSIQQSQIDPFFITFDTLDSRAVRSYIGSFLDLEKVGDDVVEHVCRWLCGRPRWTANFLEVYLVRGPKGLEGTRGMFNDSEAKVVEALDRYLLVMTTGDGEGQRRHSWNAGETSAYHGIRRAMTMTNLSGLTQTTKLCPMQRSLQKAVFNFAVGGKATYLREEPKRLIEIGVVALTTEKEGEDFVGILNEPIVVQAGINYFNLEYALQDHLLDQEAGGQGEGFEKMLLPGIQKNLNNLVERQLVNIDGFQTFFGSSYSVSSRTSYGVLAVDCKGDIAGTINWINSAVSARFEGLVAPFCYPDDHFGPDVLFLLWNKEYTAFRVGLLAQAKFRTTLNQLQALRTLVPEWLYHENRDQPAKRKRSAMVKEDLWEAWKDAKVKLFGNDKPCLRLVVQYPANHNTSANPGRFHNDDVKRCEDANCRRNHDWLATISGENGGELFGAQTLRVLKRLKGNCKEHGGSYDNMSAL